MARSRSKRGPRKPISSVNYEFNLGANMKARVFGAALLLATAAAMSPAYAADLGGDCCADLEERVAELETTTARKGNRKVSLTVYGKVNESIGWWDDGFEDNVYQFTNDTSRTRFGFKGKAKINSDWYAGFKIEVGVRGADQGAIDADDDDGGAPPFDLRKSEWTIGSKTYGAITVGEASMAHDGITQIQTANIKHFANPDVLDANDSFDIRIPGTNGASAGEWDNLAQVLEPGEGSRGNLVRYNTPTFAGFAMSAHWGEDDIWGVALRYANDIGGFKVAAGIGYGEATERDEECTDDAGQAANAVIGASCQELGLSGSVMHKPSGVFVTGAYGIRWDDGKDAIFQNAGLATDDNQFYHIQAGIEQKFTPLGKTTFFGGYQDRDAGPTVRDDTGAFNQVNGNVVTDFEFDMWEIGINQHFEAAAFDMYLHYKNYDADITTTAGKVATEEWQTVIMGGHIQF